MKNQALTGRCECGKVKFDIESPQEAITVCHCSQCRRISGHLWAATRVPRYDQVKFQESEGLTWYTSSDFAKRGFCKYCGSSLFYRMNDEEGVGIAAGCIESPTGMSIQRHIFTADKGDYYDIKDDVPILDKY
ncbi:MAG: GFA family protein [Ectothiorhodospiraceae bacterium AqS1]|nr:GFA family protein [Ectothiorhodospiraceae bacterium AqS1]